MPNNTPPAPSPAGPDANWDHSALYDLVKRTILSLPSRFKSSLFIDGVLATDLFAFNSSLGATIEEQVVQSLNSLRSVWDPEERYALYEFERQPQTFPDVVLKSSSPDVTPHIILGIELKGWYVLAKEREPSFRYKVTPAVCAPADLLVVVPWTLSKVVSGSPIVFQPFLIEARYAAQYRNWHWEFERTSSTDKSINLSAVSQHYPTKSDTISDRPTYDAGGNFGRFARTGLMDGYMAQLFDERLTGIPLSAWQRFLSIFTESSSAEEIERSLQRIAELFAAGQSGESASLIQEKLGEIASLILPE